MNDAINDKVPKIDIAMSVHNADRWIDDMVASIIAQTFQGWRLLIWNDGSSDRTGEKLSAWQKRYPAQIFVVPNSDNINLGICRGFSRVLEETSASYIMLADADDIWLPDKISLSYTAMQDAEAKHGPELPLLIHTDLSIIDSQGQYIHDSVWHLVRRRPETDKNLNQIVFEAFIYGATTIINRALLGVALPIPEAARSQDSWLAAVACSFGKISALDIKTMLYRRHESNDSVLEKPSIKILSQKILFMLSKPLTARRRIYQILGKGQEISKHMLERYEECLAPEERSLLFDFANLRSFSPLQRRIKIIKHGLWFRTLAVNIAYFLMV